MQTQAFKHWLKTEYLQRNGLPLAEGTQVSRVANCSTIEQHEGSLDVQFEHDGMKGLLGRLTFTEAEQASGKRPKHSISIRGNAANGTTTYRSAANLYRKFRISQQCPTAQIDEAQLADDFILPGETERQSLTRIRIGQRRFRSMVLERWDYRCAITGVSILLTASHIKPWKDSTASERIDSFNGLCLSPVYDKAFDGGLITFAGEGQVILSRSIPGNDMAALGISASIVLGGLSPRHLPYLRYHYAHVFRTAP